MGQGWSPFQTWACLSRLRTNLATVKPTMSPSQSAQMETLFDSRNMETLDLNDIDLDHHVELELLPLDTSM